LRIASFFYQFQPLQKGIFKVCKSREIQISALGL